MTIDFTNPELQETVNAITEEFDQIIEKVKKEYWPMMKSLLSALKTGTSLNVFGDEVEILTMEVLLSNAKTFMVKGCNEVIALRKNEPNDVIVFLTYSKDKEPLPKESNKYVIIKAKSLSDEVKALFEESEVVILK